MLHKLESFPEFDTFTSKNQGEDLRYVFKRTMFLSELVQQPRVREFFRQWGKETGLSKLAIDAAKTNDYLVKALKLPNRASLNQPKFLLDASTLSSATRRTLARREAACAKLTQTLQSIPKSILQDAVDFVRQFGCAYPFIVQSLLHGFILAIGSIAAGTPFTVLQSARRAPIPFMVDSSTSAHEFRAKKQAAQPLRGRLPKKDAIDRYAVWFVRHRIGDMSKNQLARAYHGTYHTASHKTQRPIPFCPLSQLLADRIIVTV
jgi:hypothetical protein